MKQPRNQSEFLDAIELSEGWKKEVADGIGIILTRPSNVRGGLVTIDFHKRVFAPGFTPVTQPAIKKEYKGRGWQKQIVKDAIDFLEKAMDY